MNFLLINPLTKAISKFVGNSFGMCDPKLTSKIISKERKIRKEKRRENEEKRKICSFLKLA